jgi:hypothetical protein
MAEFRKNPTFDSDLDSAIRRGMSELVRETAGVARRNLSPASIRAKAPVVSEEPRKNSDGSISGVVKYGRGLGPIYEQGTRLRFTRKGAARGFITTANRAMERARDFAIEKGLNLSRFL